VANKEKELEKLEKELSKMKDEFYLKLHESTAPLKKKI